MQFTVLFLVSLIYLTSLTAGHYKSFDDYYNMVVDNITYSQNYVLPEDNSDLVNISDPLLYDYGIYDFIIVGGGSAGAVLANRLSEIDQWNVLLLEAGGDDNDFSDIPGMAEYLKSSEMNWGYSSTPQENICRGIGTGARCPHPAGKVIGGSSTINGLVYTRGNSANFDRWVEMGNPGWSYEEVLPYFKKSEDAAFGVKEDEYHGIGGYLPVDVTSETPGLQPAVFEAFAELGVEQTDYNGRQQIGVGKTQYNLNYNKRASTARAFLDPIEHRSNLLISLRSFVTKILVNRFSKTAYGVEFVKDGRRFICGATNEIILSAGVVGSPQILMLSGIGPKNHLEDLGIEVIQDLPVGMTFQDQSSYSNLIYRTNRTFFNISLRDELELYVYNKRPLTGWSEILAFINLGGSPPTRPDVEIIVSVTGPTLNDTLGADDPDSPDFNVLHDIRIVVVGLNTLSKGTLRLQSNSPLDKPLIDPNYFNEPEDPANLLKGIKYVLRLNETKAFQEFQARFHHPPAEPCDGNFERFSDDWWYCAIKNFGSSTYHSVGTTRMGNSSDSSVVDARLKVHGIGNLRVVDAGVMPDLISGHTNAVTIMVAEKASDMIKEDYKFNIGR